MKIKAIFELRCFSKNGIHDIKRVLKKAEEMSTEDIKLTINIIAPPKYYI